MTFTTDSTAAARVQDRRRGLVHEQLGGCLQVLGQPVDVRSGPGGQVVGGQRGAVDQSAVELRLGVGAEGALGLATAHRDGAPP